MYLSSPLRHFFFPDEVRRIANVEEVAERCSWRTTGRELGRRRGWGSNVITALTFQTTWNVNWTHASGPSLVVSLVSSYLFIWSSESLLAFSCYRSPTSCSHLLTVPHPYDVLLIHLPSTVSHLVSWFTAPINCYVYLLSPFLFLLCSIYDITDGLQNGCTCLRCLYFWLWIVNTVFQHIRVL